MLFYFLSVVLWVAMSPLCYASDLNPSVGVSLILAMVAMLLAVVALVVAAYPKFSGK